MVNQEEGDGMITWFTSDTHFGHPNIIKYCNRPFKNIGEHDYFLIQRWNERVSSEDTVYHLGDFCFKKNGMGAKFYLSQLNGKIIVVRGNHDCNNGIHTNIEDIRLHIGGKDILLIHNPSNVGYTDVDLVFCGHVHNAWKFKELDIKLGNKVWRTLDIINLSVDVWGARPVNINEILREYRRWKVTGEVRIPKWR